MKKIYLFIGVGIFLFLVLALLILMTIFIRKGSPPTLVKNNSSLNNDYTDTSYKPLYPPNGAIENILITPTKTIVNSLDKAISTPAISPNKNLNMKINPTNYIDKVPKNITPTDYPTYQTNKKVIPSITNRPTPTAYQFSSDDPNAFQFMGSKLGPGDKSSISKIKWKPIPTLPTSVNKTEMRINTNNQSQYQYFTQCDGGFDNYPLPQGCTMCEAGCGPTTIAMILSNYLGQTYTPADVVEMYKQKEFYAGCDGTKITDAMTVLEDKGLQTTDFIMLIPMNKQEAITEMKKYIDAGWTIFMLGRYCADGCSHFFWITDIDSNNKVWSYDPFYNKDAPPPLDVSKYEPFPEYRIAFGVKR